MHHFGLQFYKQDYHQKPTFTIVLKYNKQISLEKFNIPLQKIRIVDRNGKYKRRALY